VPTRALAIASCKSGFTRKHVTIFRALHWSIAAHSYGRITRERFSLCSRGDRPSERLDNQVRELNDQIIGLGVL
jgi:hypothetical protein